MVARASFAQGSTALVGKAVNLLLAIVLARLLHPEAYGLFTISLVVTGLANMLSNFGFQSYIIQAKNVTAETINTCYTLNVILSTSLGLLVAGVASLWPDPPPLLPEMLALYALFIFVSGLSYIELALLKRQLEFNRSAKAELSYTVVSMSGRVGFAAAGFGALCFPLGDVIGSLVRWLFVRKMSSASLRLVRPSTTESRDVLWFGAHATSAGIASFVVNQTDKILIAISQSISSVGSYGFASNTAAMFYNAFIVPQTSVFLAAYARLREHAEEARRVLQVSTRLIFSMALPLSVVWVLEAERLLVLVFGPQWAGAAPLIRIFAVDYLIRSMFSGITGVQMAFGFVSEAARTKWINAGVFVAFLAAAAILRAGIVEYALAYVCADVITMLHNFHVNGRLLKVRWIPYFRNLAPPAAIAVASTLAWWGLRPFLEPQPPWIALIGLAGSWLLAYFVLTMAFNRTVMSTMLGVLAKRSPGGSR